MNLPTVSEVWTHSRGSLVVVALVLATAVPATRAALGQPFRVRRILQRDLDGFTAWPQERLEAMAQRSGQRALRGWRMWLAVYAPMFGGMALAILLSTTFRLAGDLDLPHRAWVSAVGAGLCAGCGAWLGQAMLRRLIRADWRRSHAGDGRGR